MIRKVFRGNRSRVLLALIALSSLPAGWWLRDALSSRTEPASADIPVVKCEELVGVFDAYPLLYLGDTFEGLPLNYCKRRQEGGTPDGIPPTDRFVFVYGTCTIEPGQSSCAVPLQVTIYPRCDSPPISIGTETIRGAQAKVLGDHALFVETPQYNVQVSSGTRGAESEALVRRAFLELRGANALAAGLTVDKPLADPAFVSAPAKDKDACSSDTTLKDASASEASAAGPSLSIDLDPATSGIQNTRTVAPGAAAEIAVVAENISAAYAGYQWELEWDDGTLDFVSGAENTAVHGIATCAAATATTDSGVGVPTGKEWAGQGAGCVSFSGTTTFSGTLVTITVQCAAGGTTDVRLVTYAEDATFGTALISDTGAPTETAYGSAGSLTCGGAAGPP